MTCTSRNGSEPEARRTLVVLQPGYLPWLGFFDQMRLADVFVYYDDVQYDKHGWRNRNRIKGPEGAHWLTVPVRHAGLGKPRISDIEIDNTSRWAKKHIGTIRQYYRDAPFAARYIPEIDDLLQQPRSLLVDLDLALAGQLASWLGISKSVLRSSELGVGGDRSERLLGLCQHVGATRYASGNAARVYLDVALFERHGIEVSWQDYVHPVYPQLHDGFVPYLSALDLILNCGPESGRVLGEGSRWTL
jgi:WbqC-like protein